MFKKLLILAAIVFFALVPAVFAKDAPPLKVREARQTVQGVDRVFSFTIDNALNREAIVRGRVVVINVYDTSLPLTLPVEDTHVPAHGTANVTVRWHDAPVIGQIRASIILDEGGGSTFVATYAFWLLPNLKVVFVLVGSLALALVAVFVTFHTLRKLRGSKTTPGSVTRDEKPKKHLARPALLKTHVPANMVGYQVEPDDTVMTLSVRFDVTWQDIVHANRLAPPYTLQPGKTLLIPRHPLRTKPQAPKG